MTEGLLTRYVEKNPENVFSKEYSKQGDYTNFVDKTMIRVFGEELYGLWEYFPQYEGHVAFLSPRAKTNLLQDLEDRCHVSSKKLSKGEKDSNLDRDLTVLAASYANNSLISREQRRIARQKTEQERTKRRGFAWTDKPYEPRPMELPGVNR